MKKRRKRGVKEKKEEKEKKIGKKKEKEEKVIESYNVKADEVSAEVKIVENPEGRFYKLKSFTVSEATAVLMENVKQKLIAEESIALGSTDPLAIKKAKERVISKAKKIFEKEFGMKEKEASLLATILCHEMLGFGNIEFLLSDPELEEVVIPNSKENVRVYHRRYGWLTTNLRIDKDETIENYASMIARRVGRQITLLNPMLDAHLLTGDRVNAVLSPIATKGSTITIRKFAREPWTVVDLIKNNTCSAEVFALIWTAIQYELNILFSGGTASGKTTMLNVCASFIPPYHRVISIEDTRELQLPEFLFWTPLVVRLPNPEGKGGVSMLDLLVNSLRMRPDRIILGEMRRQQEAEVLFEAMHTGHSVYATVHADTAAETIARLTNPPINVPANLLNAIDLCIVMFRDRRRNIRRVYQVAEFIREKTMEGVRANLIYRWNPSNDKVEKHSPSKKFFDELARRTVLTRDEINKEIKFKEKILNYLVRKNIRKLSDVGKIIHLYYTNPQAIKKLIKS